MTEIKHLNVRLKLINKSTTQWEAENPILLKGEAGIDIDRETIRIGDGVHHYLDLGSDLYNFKDDGSTIVDGSLREIEVGRVPATLVIQHEKQGGYDNTYVPKKGEPVFQTFSGNQRGIKVGDGVKNIERLSYVTPSDDVYVEDSGEVEDFVI